MTLKTRLAELGRMSPFVSAAAYFATLMLVNVISGIWPESVLAALFVLLVWAGASLCFFIVVAYHRDEDWLLSGFLLAIPSILAAILGTAVVSAVAQRSIGPLVFAAPSALLGVLTRGIILVPLAGGAVALARLVARRWKSRVA